MSVITVGIVDNDVITVKALAALLERNDDFHVIWTASSGRQVIVTCLEDERWPDVLLVDARFLPPQEAQRRLLAQLDRSAGAGAGTGGGAGAAGASPASRLSFQESQVLAMSADGLTQNEIADRLDITPASVRTHSMRARRKLGAATLTQAVVTWLRQIRRR